MLEERLKLHNNGYSKSTKAYIPWELVYSEQYETKSEAIKREYALKRIKNKSVLEKIINKLHIRPKRFKVNLKINRDYPSFF